MRGRKRLIINADGFGFGAGATQGIFDAIREGRFISSVSVNANFPEVERIRELVAEFPHISVGLHLNPMVGKPCLPPEHVPSLIGPDGFFHAERFPELLRNGKLSCNELEAEFDAQIRRAKELAGDRLTHLDSQENTHVEFFDLFLKLAQKWRVQRIRNNASLICLESPHPQWSRLKVYLCKPQVGVMHLYRRYQMRKARAAGNLLADNLITVGYAGRGNKTHRENWLRVLRNLPVGTYEIYCHPGYADDTLRRWSIYCEHRERELAVLRNPELCETARAFGVELIGFDAI
jgi:predicted glycoside hydrolase/deacetylase ChbG (UPF0249 family)